MLLLVHLKKRLRLAAKAAAGLAAALAVGALFSGCGTPSRPLASSEGPATPLLLPAPPLTGDTSGPMPPAAPREFRAAWVSTVANIDWPSRSNLGSEKQQAEAIAILDRAKALNLNAIVLQVRPSADAIYPSKLEPWSEYLTGQQGRPPQPYYDPLQFWITQAHARGIQLHAWFNPYRARNAGARGVLAREHISNTHPEAVKQYGKYLWMDPGEPASLQHTLDVVLDVVRRYDIDGVHIDDYFYPYPIDAPNAGQGAESAALEGGFGRAELDFPDQASWQRYLLGGGHLDRAAWRRENVNQLIEALYTGIHREKSWVQFGISPFGIGRPDRRPPGIAGFSQYDKLYADAELWLAKGWLDYLSPQLYWPVAQKAQAFDVLLDYWIGQNPYRRHIWPGLYTSRIGLAPKPYGAEEIVRQVEVTRTRSGADGQIQFSMAPLMENRKDVTELLKSTVYQSAALVPASPWLGATPPPVPVLQWQRDGKALYLKMLPGDKPVAAYAIWARYGKEWRFSVAPGARNGWPLPDDASDGPVTGVVVSAVDRLGNESARVTLPLVPARAVLP